MPFAAFNDGVRRVCRAPVILVGTSLLTVLVVVPLGRLVVGAPGVTSGAWWPVALAEAQGLGTHLLPSRPAAAALLLDLDRLLDRASQPAGLALLALYLASRAYVTGGVIDRYGRDRPTRSVGFLAACGLHGPRLLRLTALSILVHLGLVWVVPAWLFDTAWPLGPQLGDAGAAAWTHPAVLAVLAVLPVVGLLFDYAEVRMVVEDRHSALGALAAAGRFIRRHLVGCTVLYAASGALLATVVVAWLGVAPWVEAAGAGWATLAGLLYLVARVLVRLLFLAVETAYFQSQLAHAGWVAAPAPAWPESVSAEALGRLE